MQVGLLSSVAPQGKSQFARDNRVGGACAQAAAPSSAGMPQVDARRRQRPPHLALPHHLGDAKCLPMFG